MEKISIQSIPAMTVAYYRGIIPGYDAIGDLCCNVIGPEMARLGCKCPEPGYCYTFEHDKEYKDHDIDFEYCEQVLEAKEDSDIIKFRQNPEIPLAVCMKVYGPYEQLYQSYIDLFAYMEKEGYRMAGAPRACYVDGVWNQTDPQKWLTIIQVPAEKVAPLKLRTTNHLNLFCCPDCGNVAVAYGKGKLECCGKILAPVPVKPVEPADQPSVTEIDGEYLIEYNHPMTKDYYIAAVVAERHDNVQLFRLFPEQGAQVRLPILSGTKIYALYRQGSRIWATLWK
jgi:effector-binding domain-containing protein